MELCIEIIEFLGNAVLCVTAKIYIKMILPRYGLAYINHSQTAPPAQSGYDLRMPNRILRTLAWGDVSACYTGSRSDRWQFYGL